MPSLVPLNERVVPDGEVEMENEPVPFATLTDTGIEVDEVHVPEPEQQLGVSIRDRYVESTLVGDVQRITISYTFVTNNETLVHQYTFYTDEYNSMREGDYTYTWDDFATGSNNAWVQFVELIIGDDNPNSLIYHAKRSGEIMEEFLELCEEHRQYAAQA